MVSISFALVRLATEPMKMNTQLLGEDVFLLLKHIALFSIYYFLCKKCAMSHFWKVSKVKVTLLCCSNGGLGSLPAIEFTHFVHAMSIQNFAFCVAFIWSLSIKTWKHPR